MTAKLHQTAIISADKSMLCYDEAPHQAAANWIYSITFITQTPVIHSKQAMDPIGFSFAAQTNGSMPCHNQPQWI